VVLRRLGNLGHRTVVYHHYRTSLWVGAESGQAREISRTVPPVILGQAAAGWLSAGPLARLIRLQRTERGDDHGIELVAGAATQFADGHVAAER
jgi:hypothetical protein